MSDNNFKEVYTNDDKWIELRYVWDSGLEYYIIYDDKDLGSVISRSSIHVTEHDGPYKFVDVKAGIITFVNNYGVQCTVDPTNESTRENVKIFSGDKMCDILIREDWFHIKHILFNRTFFKLGHCYMVKERKSEEYKPMMLIGMNPDEMHFISVSHPDHFKDPGISHFYVKLKDYVKWKTLHDRFKALMEGDVWSAHKEVAEGTTDGTVHKSEDNSEMQLL